MQPQQLHYGLYGRRNVQQSDRRGFARQVLENAQQGANARAVEKLHAAEVDGDGFDSRLPEVPTLALKVARGVRVEPGRFHNQVEGVLFQFSFNDGGHRFHHVLIGRRRTSKKNTHEVT